MEKKSAFVQEIITQCEIDASAAKVYSVLSDFPNYPQWTKDITITGNTRIDGKMSVMVKDGESSWIKFSSRMLRKDEGMIAFNNILCAPFIFLGRHRYEIIPVSKNKVKLINAETFSGIAVPFVREKKLLCYTRKLKENFNLALKRFIEAVDSSNAEPLNDELQKIHNA